MDHCRLHLDPEENKLVFIFNCRHGREEEGGREDVVIGQYSLLK